MKIRHALKNEMEWINARYDEVQFVHSHFDNEIIAIAEINGEKAGLGRLVKVDENSLELGGIYVFPPFRGQGIAAGIVDFLLTCAMPNSNIYCIPFADVSHFYKKYGFMTAEKIIPEQIMEKYLWCKKFYDKDVELLTLFKL